MMWTPGGSTWVRMGNRRTQNLLLRGLQTDSRTISDLGADNIDDHGKNVLEVRPADKTG